MGKYRIGDRVRIVSEWNDYTEENDAGMMDEYLGAVMTIRYTCGSSGYKMYEDDGDWYWNEHCIEGLADEKEDIPPEIKISFDEAMGFDK